MDIKKHSEKMSPYFLRLLLGLKMINESELHTGPDGLQAASAHLSLDSGVNSGLTGRNFLPCSSSHKGSVMWAGQTCNHLSGQNVAWGVARSTVLSLWPQSGRGVGSWGMTSLLGTLLGPVHEVLSLEDFHHSWRLPSKCQISHPSLILENL